MSVAVPACEGFARINVVYAWRGCLRYPSVFTLCEVCADYLCTRIEERTWPGADGLAFLALVDYDGYSGRHCDIAERGW